MDRRKSRFTTGLGGFVASIEPLLDFIRVTPSQTHESTAKWTSVSSVTYVSLTRVNPRPHTIPTEKEQS